MRSPKSSMTSTRRRWSQQEDDTLKTAVAEHGACVWERIAFIVGTRKDWQCRERWQNHLRPGLKKDEWTLEDDATIVEAVKRIGANWASIAKLLPGRAGSAVKNRFHKIRRHYDLPDELLTAKPADRAARRSSMPGDATENGPDDFLTSDGPQFYSLSNTSPQTTSELPRHLNMTPTYTHPMMSIPRDLVAAYRELRPADFSAPKFDAHIPVETKMFDLGLPPRCKDTLAPTLALSAQRALPQTDATGHVVLPPQFDVSTASELAAEVMALRECGDLILSNPMLPPDIKIAAYNKLMEGIRPPGLELA